ncbi:PLX2-like protein [Mya arenaria]|uniref:PLX2-like protein n=1 Tax=Mya arenaria TaxID=6604 RepID=A0ABY7FY45_MYAAR|nr:PLX2-like protein [Mya arenaria]
MVMQVTTALKAQLINDTEIMCHILKDGIPRNLDSTTSLHVDFQSKKLDGLSLKVVFYQCGSLIYPKNNCGQCESFKYYQPYLKCKWCNGQCIYSGKVCATAETMCPDPVITKVYPLSAHIDAVTPIIVEGFNLASHINETKDVVSLGNISCLTIYPFTVADKVSTRSIPKLTRIFPNYGPLSGGTNITLYGEHLDTGWERMIKIGEQLCGFVTVQAFTSIKPTLAECKTVKSNSTTQMNAPVSMVFDDQAVGDVNFTYVPDPVVWNIQPKKSFQRVSFVMDDVGSVRDLPSNISVLLYYPDPTFYNFNKTLHFTQVIIIKGEHLDVAATAEDVQVLIGCEKCNVTTLEPNRVICNPPTSAPKCTVTRQTLFSIKVSIGFLQREVGQIEYEVSKPFDKKNIQLIVGVVAGVVLFLLLLFVIGYQTKKKSLLRARLQQEREGYEHKLAKIEGRYRNPRQEGQS